MDKPDELDVLMAIDNLRRLLDERGVEWRRTPHYSSESIDNETVFRGDGIDYGRKVVE